MSAISLDPPILAWLDRALRGESVIAAARLGGGYINKNTVITTAGAKYVLRRYGRGAESARICAVEAALADRLSGTAVPIAEVIAADPAGTEAGEPLLLARHIDGVTLGAAIASDGGSAEQIGQAAGRALAAIGAVNFERAGFFTGPDLVPSAAGMPGSLQEFVETCLQAGHAAQVMNPEELAGLRALAARETPLAGLCV